MDGLSTVITGTVGTTLSFSNTTTTSGNLTNTGGTQLIDGHMWIGLIIFLLLHVGHRLGREYSQFKTLESLEEKEQE